MRTLFAAVPLAGREGIAEVTLSGSRISQVMGSKGGVLGQQRGIRHGRSFGWRQLDFASSWMMLRVALMLFGAEPQWVFSPGVGQWGCPAPPQTDP